LNNNSKAKRHVGTITRITDVLWNEIKYFTCWKTRQYIGRPIVLYRKVFDGIIFVLRTGCQWKLLPKVFGSGSTCNTRFQEWTQPGIIW